MNTNNQLFLALDSLGKSLIIIYRLYSQYIKSIALIIIAYGAFKIGKLSVTDKIKDKVKQLDFILKNRETYTVVLPAKIKNLNRSKNILLILIVLFAIFLILLNQFTIKLPFKIKIEYLLIAEILFTLILFLLWAYQAFLNLQLRKGAFNDHQIIVKLKELVELFGKKVEGLLKINLCRDKILSRKRNPVGVCSKDKCKNERELLKQKYINISTFVNSVLNFQWCSVCKKRAIFDQFLSFQSNNYQKPEDISNQEEVNMRNAYLQKQIERMVRWYRDIQPCNCSKLYWNLTVNQIKQFKKIDKQLEEKLTQFQSKSSQKSSKSLKNN